MSEYKEFNVFLSDYQKRKLKTCINKGKPCSLNIENKPGNFKLHLTDMQIAKILIDRKKKKGSQIELTKEQLAKSGGFILPLLAAAAPLILRGLATGAASYIGSKAIQKVSGKGAYIPENEYGGNGLKKTKKSKKKH